MPKCRLLVAASGFQIAPSDTAPAVAPGASATISCSGISSTSPITGILTIEVLLDVSIIRCVI
ncbi:unknown [Collinsella sp. CAG:398]|nr:unknown [Collinsella sp. CAG:398]